MGDLERELRAMEAADPKLAELARRIDDAEHYLRTGEEVGTFRRNRNRARRLAVMKARRRLWPTRGNPQ